MMIICENGHFDPIFSAVFLYVLQKVHILFCIDVVTAVGQQFIYCFLYKLEAIKSTSMIFY